MLNIKDLRDDFDNIKIALANRGYDINQKTFEKLDNERKTLQVDVENLQAERNKLSNDFGKLKSSGEDTSQLKDTIDKINSELDEKSLQLSSVLSDINNFLLDIPNIPHESVIKGDSISMSIAAASIIAKVERDKYMLNIDNEHPEYKWKKNKGYGTKDHQNALNAYGVTKHHRKSFSPIRKILSLSAD